MIDPELLTLLCCPETHQSLRSADRSLIDRLNQQITSGQLKNLAGQITAEPLDGGLVRADGQVLYPIRHGNPIMLAEEAIRVD
jgi:uncharacterized protein YbaR (Trm112 family)